MDEFLKVLDTHNLVMCTITVKPDITMSGYYDGGVVLLSKDYLFKKYDMYYANKTCCAIVLYEGYNRKRCRAAIYYFDVRELHIVRDELKIKQVYEDLVDSWDYKLIRNRFDYYLDKIKDDI